LVGVDVLSRSDDSRPPAGRCVPEAGGTGQVAVAGEGVQHQDGVAALLVEGAPRLPGDANERQAAAALQVERPNTRELAVTGRVAVAPGTGCRGLSEELPAVGFGDVAERDAVFRGLPIHGLASIAGVGGERRSVTPRLWVE